MDVHIVNRNLREQFGEDFLGQPNYRVVWSDDQIEKRFGTFRDYISGTNVLIREVKEVRECKKYPDHPKQWILEKLFFNRHNSEILDNDTFNPRRCTYEPFWVFGHERNGRAKRPVWRMIYVLIKLNTDVKALTPSEMSDREKAQAFEDERIMDELLNTHVKSDAFHSSVQDGDTVILDSTKRMETKDA